MIERLVESMMAALPEESRQMTTASSDLRLRRERPGLGLGWRVGQRAELRGHAARDRGGLAAGLEAGEVRAVAPGERAAQPDAGLERGVVHDVDRPLVVGRALTEAGEVAEIAAGRE